MRGVKWRFLLMVPIQAWKFGDPSVGSTGERLWCRVQSLARLGTKRLGVDALNVFLVLPYCEVDSI